MRDWWSTLLEWLSITCDLDLDLDLGSGHTAYGRASLINLYLHTKFHWNWKNFFVDALTKFKVTWVTQKLRQIWKIRSDQISILCCSLRISGHLPAAIVNGGGDRVGKVHIFETSQTPWPWPWIGSYGILSCITHRPVCTHQISFKSEKLFAGRSNRRDPSKFKVTWNKN